MKHLSDFFAIAAFAVLFILNPAALTQADGGKQKNNSVFSAKQLQNKSINHSNGSAGDQNSDTTNQKKLPKIDKDLLLSIGHLTRSWKQRSSLRNRESMSGVFSRPIRLILLVNLIANIHRSGLVFKNTIFPPLISRSAI